MHIQNFQNSHLSSWFWISLCVITNLSKGNVINNGSFFFVVVVFVPFLAIHGKGKDKNSIYANFWNVLEWAVGVVGWVIPKIYTKSNKIW